MSASLAEDPFGAASGAAGYVPRRATEEALERLVRSVLEGGRIAVVQGPGGMGKTVLLRRLSEVAGERFRPLYLPFAALSPEDLSHWVLSALGLGSAADPVEALQAHLSGRTGSGAPVLLLVDDATALPLDTARWLAELCRTAAGGLRLALAALEGPAAAGLVAALGHAVEVAPLTSPMSREETRAYVTARLARASAPKARRAVFDETFERLHAVSRGNPRRLHFAADALMRGEPPESIDAVLGEEQPVRAPRRSGLSALIRPSAPNRAGTFRFAHEALRPPREVAAAAVAVEPVVAVAVEPVVAVAVEPVAPVAVEPAAPAASEPAAVEAAATVEPAVEAVVPAAIEPVAVEAVVPAAIEPVAIEAAAPAIEPAAVAVVAHPDTEITPEDLGGESWSSSARAFLAAFLRRERENPRPGEPGPPDPAAESVPWARPQPAAPHASTKAAPRVWAAAASRRAAGAVRVTAARARRVSGAWAAARGSRSAGSNPFLGHVRARRAPVPWRRELERLLFGGAALALLGLAIVYVAPPLAEVTREFLAGGVSAAGDGFEWVAEVVEDDFSSAREVATGDYPSAQEMMRARLGSAAETLLHVPERLLAPPEREGSSAPPPSSGSTRPGWTALRREARSPEAVPAAAPAPARTGARADLGGWPRVVRIGINASPWAQVSVDGFAVGETPIADFPLLAGTYRFKATFPDGTSVEREIEVGPETTSIVFP